MKILELARSLSHHVRNAVAEEIYLRTGRDATIPVSIYGVVIERCNYKCRYCDYGRRPNYRDEMSIEEWQKALLDLKNFIGHYHIEFSGGEPYIKKGFVDLITFSARRGSNGASPPMAAPSATRRWSIGRSRQNRSTLISRSIRAMPTCTIIRAASKARSTISWWHPLADPRQGQTRRRLSDHHQSGRA